MYWSMLPLVLILHLFLRDAVSQDDYSDEIKCYSCNGTVENSTCSDPVDVSHKDVTSKICARGICLKWTKYKDGVLWLFRSCSIDVDFHLTMIDGVCRTERNGNGYLCMCGKNLCNSAPGQLGMPRQLSVTMILLMVLACFEHLLQTFLLT